MKKTVCPNCNYLMNDVDEYKVCEHCEFSMSKRRVQMIKDRFPFRFPEREEVPA